MSTKRTGVSCYDRAGMDEPLFVLRAQDRLAAGTVRYWAILAENGGTKPEIVEEARRLAQSMDDWPFHKHPGTSVERHYPDAPAASPAPSRLENGNLQDSLKVNRQDFQVLKAICEQAMYAPLNADGSMQINFVVRPEFYATMLDLIRFCEEKNS